MLGFSPLSGGPLSTADLDTGLSQTLTGVAATSSLGTITENRTAAPTLSAVTSTGVANSIVFTGAGSASISSVSATSSIGTISSSGTASSTLTSLSSTSAINSLAFSGKADITLGGGAVAVLLGTPPTIGFSNTVAVSGVQASGSVGTALPSITGETSLTGVSTSSSVDSLRVNLSTNIFASDFGIGVASVTGGQLIGLANVTAPAVTATMAANAPTTTTINQVNLFSVVGSFTLNLPNPQGFVFDYNAVADNYDLSRTIFIQKTATSVPDTVFILPPEPDTIFIRDDKNGLGNTVHIIN